MGGSDVTYTLREIVDRFGGELLGDEHVRIARVATLEGAGPDAIGFLANPRYLHQLKATRAAAVIIGHDARDALDTPRIISDNPYLYYARVSTLLNPPRALEPGIHPSASVDATAHVEAGAEVSAFAHIAAGAHIGAGAMIGSGVMLGRKARVGRDARIHAHVAVYDECTIGERTIVHSGAVIGADGFGIGVEVALGANTTIDRGALEDTVIEDGVKLDNQIQIAHNVRIGAHTAIAACTGIAGSVQIGRYCRIGGGVGIAGHVTIADHVEISGGTSITRSIGARGAYTGVYPFEPNREWRRNAVQLRHLAELARRVAALEEAVRRSQGPQEA